MIRADLLIFGYRVITFKEEDVANVANILLDAQFAVRFHKNSIYVRGDKIKKVLSAIGTRVEFEMTELLGMGGVVYNFRKRLGGVAALSLCLILYVFLSDIVWDVRIEGNETDENRLLSELSCAGLEVGARWSGLNRSALEVEVLENSEEISWVNINRRGGVAYVSVVRKNTHDDTEKSGFNNIVSTYDGVIEEITVVRGIAVVKVGDSVKKGDVLISGVLPSELGGGFCYAEGCVRARVSDSILVSVENKIEKKIPKTPVSYRVDVNIFKFSINIFKRYRNFDNTCDIIDKKIPIYLFNGKKAPVSITQKAVVPYSFETVSLTEDEMTSLALDKMSAALSERLSNADLVRLRTNGCFLEDFYFLKTEFVSIENIGRDLKFEVSKP